MLRQGAPAPLVEASFETARAGHLVIIDRRADRSWEEKVFRRREAQPL